MGIIELLAIGFTALIGQIGVYSGAWYFYRRNIYTQKILYLNDRLSKLDEESLIKFRIERYIRIRPHLSYEDHYPPPIKEDYLKNPDYKKLQNSFRKLSRRLGKMAKIFGLIYAIGMSFLGLLYLIIN